MIRAGIAKLSYESKNVEKRKTRRIGREGRKRRRRRRRRQEEEEEGEENEKQEKEEEEKWEVGVGNNVLINDFSTPSSHPNILLQYTLPDY